MSLELSHKHIYFDNAATSFPKPEGVVKEVSRFMLNVGATPERSAHELAIESSETLFDGRMAISELFGCSNPMKVIFTSNATEALNLAIQGHLRGGERVVTTSMEHNSTIRILRALEHEKKIELVIVDAKIDGSFDSADFQAVLNSKTSLCVVNHGSNVLGTLAPISEIGEWCRALGITFLVDAAQTAGVVPIDMNASCVDLLAFTGHKGLHGPMGTGGLVFGDQFNHKKVKPLIYGGTGSLSDQDTQPDFLPDCFESGTPNVPGVAGLIAGIEYIHSDLGGVDGVNKHKKQLVSYFIDRVHAEVEKVEFYCDKSIVETGVVSFNIRGMDAAELSLLLADEFSIMSRPGLHCAPNAHRTIGTYPGGAVRFSFGVFNTTAEIDEAVEAIASIARRAK